MKLAAFNEARAAFQRHREAFEPSEESPGEDQRAYEASYAPLVAAMTDAGTAAVECPATSIQDLAGKLDLFRSEEMHDYEAAGDLIDFIVDDARRLAGVEP
jgi:hypothetical protein